MLLICLTLKNFIILYNNECLRFMKFLFFISKLSQYHIIIIVTKKYELLLFNQHINNTEGI
jgi:hypothetical protein